MEKYINKAAILAEIKRIYNEDYKFLPSDLVESVQDFKDDLLAALDSLEAKEVDYRQMDKDFERDAVSFCIDNGLNTTPNIAKTIAKHFFELGLKAQKED